jgi:hypothetical protein
VTGWQVASQSITGWVAGDGTKHPFALLIGKTQLTAKRTSNLVDVQKVLAEPFPGTVAQGVSLPKV